MFSCRQLDSRETYLAMISFSAFKLSTREHSTSFMITGATENSSGELAYSVFMAMVIRVHLVKIVNMLPLAPLQATLHVTSVDISV